MSACAVVVEDLPSPLFSDSFLFTRLYGIIQPRPSTPSRQRRDSAVKPPAPPTPTQTTTKSVPNVFVDAPLPQPREKNAPPPPQMPPRRAPPPPPKALKVRVLTWNMHNGLPKVRRLLSFSTRRLTLYRATSPRFSETCPHIHHIRPRTRPASPRSPNSQAITITHTISSWWLDRSARLRRKCLWHSALAFASTPTRIALSALHDQTPNPIYRHTRASRKSTCQSHPKTNQVARRQDGRP